MPIDSTAGDGVEADGTGSLLMVAVMYAMFGSIFNIVFIVLAVGSAYKLGSGRATD